MFHWHLKLICTIKATKKFKVAQFFFTLNIDFLRLKHKFSRLATAGFTDVFE